MTQHWIADTEGNLDPASEEQIAAEYPELSTFATLAEAKGELVICNTKAGVAVFRVPVGSEYDRFLGALLGDQKDAKVKASKILAQTCVVSPDRDTFTAWCAKYPGIPSACTKPLNKIMGGELAARGKD